MKLEQVHNITIYGVGLIGGSLGLALKRYGFNGNITGLGRRMSTLKTALERNAVDRVTLEPGDSVAHADIVVIAAPVDVIADSVRKLSPYLSEDGIFTDVGSIKKSVVTKAEKSLPESLYFVGAHPMAGSEKSGVKAAHADLFEGAKCILTPTESTNQAAFQVVKKLWETVGANVRTMSPEEHDYLIAAASHLPHVIACVLTQTVANLETHQNRALDFTATGFRDSTRIAAGSPNVWESILSDNSQSLVKMIDEFIDILNVFKQSLNDFDKERLRELLIDAKMTRDSIT